MKSLIKNWVQIKSYSHHEIRLRNGKGIIGLSKKYILTKLGGKEFFNDTLAFQAAT